LNARTANGHIATIAAFKPTSNTIQLPTFATGTFFVVIMLKDGSILTQKMMIQK